MTITKKTFSVLILLLSIFTLNTIECNEIHTHGLLEAPQQKTTLQRVTHVLSKTIDCTLLLTALLCLVQAAVIEYDLGDYDPNATVHESLLISASCTAAYFIKNKCIS